MTARVHGRGLRLDGLLSNAAAIAPDRTAVLFGDVSLTYREVDERARRLAAMLAQFGVGKGDRVAYWAPNRAEFVETIFGIPFLGAIAVPLDHWAKPDDLLAILARVSPKVLIVGGEQAAALADRVADLEAAGVRKVLTLDTPTSDHFLSYATGLAAAVPLEEPTPVARDDAAVILFTSGSTGLPKGAVHSHRDLCATAQIVNHEFGLRDGECTLHFLPVYSSCLEHLIPLTLACATHVIMPRFDAAGAWDAIARYKVTHIDAVPTTLRRLLEQAPMTIPESLRLVTYASEPMSATLIAALLERMPAVDFVQFYGMIEQLCLAVQGPAQQRSNPGTVGRPMLGAEMRILDEQGEATDGRAPGEIVARSPTLFSGYWQDPAATAQIIQDGWMRTGDIGHFDDDGFLVLSGRLKQVIKTGGVTVIPNEVEDAMLGHERVREVAVVGIPDEAWGEAVHAFVVLHPGSKIEKADLIAFCRSRLAGYKSPKAVHFVDDLPRTGIGKISRKDVREQYLLSRQSEVAA
jgi:acyl-CoA synthetase (AMP-forming)/AMP-acid ligase II